MVRALRIYRSGVRMYEEDNTDPVLYVEYENGWPTIRRYTARGHLLADSLRMGSEDEFKRWVSSHSQYWKLLSDDDLFDVGL